MAEETLVFRTTDNIYRDRTTGVANTEHTLSAASPNNTRRVCYAAVKYSGAPTQAGVRFELDSGAGAAFDAILNQGAANVQDTVWIPSGEVLLTPGDALRIVAPAGGIGITASITVVTKDV